MAERDCDKGNGMHQPMVRERDWPRTGHVVIPRGRDSRETKKHDLPTGKRGKVPPLGDL